MARYFGAIGFAVTEETAPGIWEEVITERKYYGDILRNSRRYQQPDKVNSDINISNQISVIADPYLNNNLDKMRYVTFMGSKWRISDIEVEFPRITLSIGGLYIEQT
jgi:hypothetical protein